MGATQQVAVRLDVDTVKAVDEQVRQLSASLRRRFNRSDVIRLAVDDYLRRNA